MLKLSQRTEKLKPSPTMAISTKAGELRAQGHDVISLSVGEPDFNTPEPAIQAAIDALHKGVTKYTPAAGFLALRETIAEKVTRENKFDVSPEEVIVTQGAKQAIFLTLQCLCQENEVVLLPTPNWVSYGPLIELSGGSIFPLPLYAEDGFLPNLDRWKGMNIPKNATGIILNSPSNPTGAVIGATELKKVVSWAMQRNLWIMSDEIYEKILYEGATHTSVASLGPEVKSETITISGCSKSYAMTGWRVGWAIGPKPLIKKMNAFQSQSSSNVTSFAQCGAIAALKLPDSALDEMMTSFTRRRAYVMERLDALSDYLSYSAPHGAFYFFVNISKWANEHKMSDVEFCEQLLEKEHVGLVPGSAFGAEKFVRMSYATSDEKLAKAFDRIESFLKA